LKKLKKKKKTFLS